MSVYGYIRVSSREQNEDRQLVAMGKAHVPRRNIFMDKQSGKDFNRPQFKRLMKKIRPNDLIIVKSIDRLGRNYREIQEQWKLITVERKVDIYVIDMPMLDTRREKNLLGTFISDLVLTLLSYVAENERVNIRQRQAEGIAAAKARGVQFGRRPTELPDNFEEVRHRWLRKEITVTQAAKECGMPQTTFYERARKIEQNKKENSGNS